MVRDLIRNQAPGNRLRVRIPCPPLKEKSLRKALQIWGFISMAHACVPLLCQKISFPPINSFGIDRRLRLR